MRCEEQNEKEALLMSTHVHSAPCLSCRAPTPHRSGQCAPCREIQCRSCGTRFIPKAKSRATAECGPCAYKTREKSRRIG